MPTPDPNAPTGSYPPDATPTASDQRGESTPPRSLDPAAGPVPEGSARFRPVRFHKAGGMGRVHRAEDTELSRPVAFKDIQPDHADSAAARARLVFEAEVTGRLEHPGVVPVYGLGRDAAGRPFYAMRFVEGESLRDAVKAFHAPAGPTGADRALALRRLLARFVSVCQTVAFAHSQGVLHRDLKPDNVMLGPFGETLVVDWGLAKRVRAAAGEAESMTDLGPGPAAHGATRQCGTPAYWSPEQHDARPYDHDERTDVFGLGAVLHAILTGRPPNDHGRPHRIPPGPRAVAKWVDLDLDRVVRRALAYDPADRFPSAAGLAAEVERWLADQPIAAQRALVRALAARAAAQRGDTALAEQLARQRANLGLMFSGMGRDAEAVVNLTEAADAFAALAAARRRLRLRADEANCRLALARSLLALGRADEAAAANKAASAIYAGLVDAGPTEYRANYADIMLTHAGLPPAEPAPDVPPAEQTLAGLPAEPVAGEPTEPAPAAGESTRDDSPDPSDEMDLLDADSEASAVMMPAPGRSASDPNPTGLSFEVDPNPTAASPADAPAADAWTEAPAGFTVLREAGRGGMGRVFLARDNQLGRFVAIKTLLAGADGRPEVAARFRQEARLTAGLDHPNVVRVYGTGAGSDGRPFVILEYLSGTSLLGVINDLGPGWSAAHLDPLAQACDGLHHAHGRGVVHRDPKPSNVIVLSSGRAVVYDWGLAKDLGLRSPEPGGWTAPPPDPGLTADGAVMGTPAYLAPEMCGGAAGATPATDVYILGAGLHHVVAGRPPHGGGPRDAVEQARTGRFPRLREVRPDAPAALDAICAKAMALRPEDRYPTAAALGADIRAFLAGRAPSVAGSLWARLFRRG